MRWTTWRAVFVRPRSYLGEPHGGILAVAGEEDGAGEDLVQGLAAPHLLQHLVPGAYTRSLLSSI